MQTKVETDVEPVLGFFVKAARTCLHKSHDLMTECWHFFLEMTERKKIFQVTGPEQMIK